MSTDVKKNKTKKQLMNQQQRRSTTITTVIENRFRSILSVSITIDAKLSFNSHADINTKRKRQVNTPLIVVYLSLNGGHRSPL